MTEQPDTAAIRARRYPFLPDMGTIIVLCNALDAARAELADFRAEFTVLDEAHSEEMARAEAVEDRIAKAKTAYDLEDEYEAANAMYRALTEGTGQ